MKPQLKAVALACAGVLLCALPSQSHAGQVVVPYKLSNFSHPLSITNTYLSMTAGRHIVFEELDGEDCVVDDMIVTEDSKSFGGTYAGLVGRVVTDTAWADEDCDGGRDVLLEDTFDWYAQDNAGRVWYLGEDTTAFFYDDNGQPTGTSKEGSWEAGVNGAQAGIVMLAHPAKDQWYRQEYAQGVAEDQAKVTATRATVTIELGTYTGCVVTRETSRLEPGVAEDKSYCPVVGLVKVQGIREDSSAEVVDTGLP